MSMSCLIVVSKLSKMFKYTKQSSTTSDTWDTASDIICKIIKNSTSC